MHSRSLKTNSGQRFKLLGSDEWCVTLFDLVLAHVLSLIESTRVEITENRTIAQTSNAKFKANSKLVLIQQSLTFVVSDWVTPEINKKDELSTPKT
jgi:hypothetical protein